MTDLSNNVAIITGAVGNLGTAVGNLGTAVANAFGAAGAKTVLVDRSQGRLTQAFEEDVNRYLLGRVDLTSEGSVRALVSSRPGALRSHRCPYQHSGRFSRWLDCVRGRPRHLGHDDDGQSADHPVGMPRCDPCDADSGQRRHRQRFRRCGPFQASGSGGLQCLKGRCPQTDGGSLE